MACSEHQPEHVVLDVALELDLVHRGLVVSGLTTEQLDLAPQGCGTANRVDAAPPGDSHEPAISLADSIRQTASIACWVAEVTAA